jgi:molybdopterin synthase sulfur carrier subunit
MTVTVKFFANTRQLLGKEELTLSLDPSKIHSIRDVLLKITNSECNEISTMLIEITGNSCDTLQVVINGKNISSLDGLETKVQDGDRIMIFPLLAGG